eukprot:INCI8195.1.p1 GENE.INCI8195.1~~INCI8195.1.p1  ORF type:complete len:436 (-),score=91.27 INCI8195.1:323-1630(-)
MDAVSAFTRDVLDDTVAETMRSLKPLLLDRGFSLSQVLRLQAKWSAKLELAVVKCKTEGTADESENASGARTQSERERSNSVVEQLHCAKQRFVDLKAASRLVPTLGPNDPRNSLVPGQPADFVPQAVSSAPSFLHEDANVDESVDGNRGVDAADHGRGEASSRIENSDHDDGSSEGSSIALEQGELDAIRQTTVAGTSQSGNGAIGEPSVDNVSLALQSSQEIENETNNEGEQAEFDMSGTDSDDVPDYLKGLEDESFDESEEADIDDSVSNMGANESTAAAGSGGRSTKDSDDSSIDLDEFSSSSGDEDPGKSGADRSTVANDHGTGVSGRVPSSATTLQENDRVACASDLRPRSVIVAQCHRRVERSSWFGRASIARFRNAAISNADDGAAVAYGIGKPGKRWLFHLRFVVMNVHGEPIRALHELQVLLRRP